MVGEAVKGYSVAVGSYSTVQATITIGKILSSPPTELTSGAESGNKDEKPKQEKSSEPKKEVESKQQENGNQKKSKKETESKKTENKGKSNNENKSNKEQNSNNRNNEISKNQNISEQNQPQSDLNNNSNIERNFNNLSENEKAMFEKYEKNGWKGQVSGGPANAGREYKNDGRLGGEILPKENTKGTITYKEFDINVKTGEFRDGYRFVKGSDGSVYYTDDHYMTFTRVK